MTAMRDALNDGPVLCEVHRRVGGYLATEFVTSVIGLEKYPIPHVQGNSTDGFRLRNEDRTLIVPLIRGGEPMARGVWEVFPRAMYRHAKITADIENEHLEGKVNAILVDSVVNTGKSLAEFVQYLRNLHATILIVVVAGVVQVECASGGILSQTMAGSYDTLSIVTLRVSKTKYTGSGGTDTGNRLFNTTHLA
jgi:uracil phosphoribosyltransferase